MLTKKGHITYWQTSSEDDWRTVQWLFEGKRYLHSLFFAHLTLEKLCKAIWVKQNADNFPPKIHHLMKILQQTDVALLEEQIVFLQAFNDYQIEGRYPDYLFKINKICTYEHTQELLETVKIIRQCLQEKLQ